MIRLKGKEDLNDKKEERVEWMNESIKMPREGPFLYIFENDIRRNVFKILDTSFEGLCLKTPNRLCLLNTKYII